MKENKLGVMPINKLIMSMSLPIMLSMLIQALYNIVDSIFVSKINLQALSAVSMAFPIQNMMIGVGVGTAVGVNALLARALGEKNQEKVNKIANNGVFLILVSYAIFLVVGLFFSGLFFRSQTKTPEIIKYGKEYMSVICCFSFGLFIQLTFERLLQATGKTIHTMISQMVGAVINIILDPILIFGLLGLPKMGVSGAAWATVIGQIIAAIVNIVLNQKCNHEVKLNLKGFRPSAQIIGNIYKIGVPSIIMQAIGSFMVYGMNQILTRFTYVATAVFGVYFKLNSFVFMPVFGLNNGVIPILAYNYGARKKDRVKKTFNHAAVFAICIMTVGLIIFQIFPKELMGIFDKSESVLNMGVPALRIISLSFPVAGFCIACSGYFQAMGKAYYSMFVSLARQLIVLLPVAFLLSKLGQVNDVWWAFPIAEVVSFGVTMFFLARLHKKLISQL